MFGASFYSTSIFTGYSLNRKSLFIERYLKQKHGVWFFAFAAIILVIIMYLSQASPLMMLAAAVGSATFFIPLRIETDAEPSERQIVEGQAA